LANPWVFVGLTGGALTQALLLHGSVPDAGWALYPTFLAGGVAAWLAWPIVCVFVASALPHGYRSLRFVLYFVVGYVSWSVLTHLVALLLKRTLATGIDLPFSDGTLTHSLSREAPKDLVTFAWLCAARTAYCLIEQERLARLQRAELEARLAQSQLSALSAQLHPHFLFNALNTVSALMYEDVARADALIQDVGDLLRSSFNSQEGATWSLADELVYTRRFVGLLEARFMDRVRVTWHISDDALAARVPRFALQTLVENAFKHNELSAARLTIAVRGVRTRDQLSISVSDDGLGIASSTPTGGTGLRRLAEMLRLLHGDHASITTERPVAGGLSVRLALPFFVGSP
jgi:two-component system LytT family sensor kinase